ncbi:MAG: L,D-transpeptidase family protein [Nevskia sp.]|nr:L,D-transpeptidase family protein [Nevskia sp.]
MPNPACSTRVCAGLPRHLLLLVLFALTACAASAQNDGAEHRSPLQLQAEALPAGGTLLLPDSGLTLNDAVKTFYQRRDYAPAWADRDRARALQTALQELSLDGLDPEDYRAGEIRRSLDTEGALDTEAQRTAFELLATHSYLLALTHLAGGKVDPRRFDPDHNFDARRIDPQQSLDLALAGVEDGHPETAFERARPQHPLYAGLRKAMASLRDVAAQGGWPKIPEGPTLRPGASDPRVPVLRRRLAASGYLPKDLDDAALDNPGFDGELSAALSRYQDEQYLGADGNLGPATRAALNVPVQARIDQLRVNLERARWLLHEVQGDLVVVDIAGYKLHYFQGGEMPAWSTRVQVGKPYRMTPVFKSAINEIVFNPAWVVPPTIYREDILPKLRHSRAYLAANRLHVYDAQWHELKPDGIDFNNPPPGLRLRQEAGPGGALGRIKINFPNPYAVYLHETPHAALFDRRSRAFSSGCIRVEQPYDLAVRLLNDPENWDRAAVDAAVATNTTRVVKLATPVPVLLAYWTVDLHEDGRIAFKPDVYGLDEALLKALEVPVAGRDE